MVFFKKIFNSYLPAIVWWFFVLALMCTPGKDLPDLGSWTDLISLDKIIHVTIFSLMAYLFMRPIAIKKMPAVIKQQSFLKIAISISLWGLAAEFIQEFWIEGRSFDIWDFVADSVGAITAYFYAKKYLLK